MAFLLSCAKRFQWFLKEFEAKRIETIEACMLCLRLFERQPHKKTTPQEGDPTERQTQRKTTSQEDKLTEKHHHSKKTSHVDDLK